ncbi:hypothetical protein [Flavobacterium subsaxonicum]|uniref:Uncharacterized protein n=1 Tax=Flavobacterium subsaxonicum WB 4.1-42 = DSM 21790 TaxID=1121898 RepID=A0A0A2ME40_9FLAO|nr:hypothetical protein [Flavobacterium subsaxonicum]KGO90544.1 hypothetical protein Q766_21115 [Flavobacterium subsaxonicum WB 4.1-42 = DSM 21790]
MKKSVLILIIFFVVAIAFIFIDGFIQSRREYVEKYDFVIKNIKTDIKGNLTFYDNLNNKYFFSGYWFSKYDKLGISTGDKIFKDHYSKNMIIYRQVNNKYQIYYIQEPNGLIPFSLYSY